MNNFKIRLFVLSFLALSFSSFVQGQCAGTDSTIEICNKDADDTNRNYNLFSQLGGTPTAGGTWATTNPENFYALNQSTGIVDLWRINNYGVHVFSYTNTACNQTASVTINLGGYPGEDNIDGSANACGDDSNVNLHGFLGSNVDGKVQDFNGLWEEDPSTITNQLEDNIFNAQAAGPGIYIFTYTTGSLGGCASRTATVVLEVHPPANAGIATSITFCTNDDFSTYTNFDLNGQLSGEDPNGTWSEVGTNQLSDLNDSFINIEELNANFGYGTYSFTYTVYPSHPVCEEKEVTVNIDILPVLDGEITVPNYCFGSEYTVEIQYDETILHNGSFLIQYRVNGTITDAGASLSNGNGSFIIDPDIVPLNQIVELEITGITGVTPLRDVCPRVIVPSTTFLVASSKADVQDICVNNDATVTLTDILDSGGNAANGLFNVAYSLTNPDNSTTDASAFEVLFTNGNASFIIDSSNFTADGDYEVELSIENTFALNCRIADLFSATPIPSEIQLDLLVDNNCDATQIDVLIDAPILADGTYTITYDVTELGSNTVLTTNTINFTGGTANYQIDVDALPVGNYTASVRSVQNDTTRCRLVFEFEENENFSRGGVPEPPQATANQTFCLSDFPGGPTLMDIEVTSSGDLLFYATETDTDMLPITTPLVDGEDYFISNTDTLNNCEGTERISVTVSFSNPNAPTSTNLNPLFCAENNPTLSSIDIDVTTGSSVVWFDASANGNPLDATTVLEDGESYFAATNSSESCTSTNRLEIIPTVVTVAPTSLSGDAIVVCGLDNPTVLELRTLEEEIDNEVFWYSTENGGIALTDDIALVVDTIYYAENYNPTTGCSSAIRIPVTVDLSNCDPENYDFFIPDGFSPNADGRNDTFFIPNIETIFPNFTLEILNRYGTTLFKGDITKPAWDGSNGSSTAPNGVYFYIINYNKGNSEPIQGRLYLNR
jgi:gliding motility-associated-like protein